MMTFVQYMQSGNAKLQVVGELTPRELEPDQWVSETVSYPPEDMFHTFVMKEKAVKQLSHSEDVFMAQDGFTLEGLQNQLERLAVDDRFIEARLTSPVSPRFCFEVHSEDGKSIRAIVVEVRGKQKIKTLMDAQDVLLTCYDAVVGGDGNIKYAALYPGRILLHPALFAAPLTPEQRLGMPTNRRPFEFKHVVLKYKPETKPATGPAFSVIQEVVAKKPMLPGLGGNAIKPSPFNVFTPALATDNVALTAATDRSAISEQSMNMNKLEVSKIIMDRFNEAMMLFHVMAREPKFVLRQTKEQGGIVRTNKGKGKPSLSHYLNIDPVEFRLLTTKRAEDIVRAFEDPQKAGYGDYGLQYIKRHPRRLPTGVMTEVSPYFKHPDEVIQKTGTQLVLQLEKAILDGDVALKKSISMELARMLEQYGAEPTKARFLEGSVTKVFIADPSRNNPLAPESKTDRAPK